MKLKVLDIAVIAFALLLAVLIWAAPQKKAEAPTAAVISADGKQQRISLPANEAISINGVDIIIEEYTAFVMESDCPDKTCVKTGTLTLAGQRSVCLPNRVIVSLEGNGAHVTVR